MILTVMIAGIGARAQGNVNKKCNCQFQSINIIGLLEGETGTSFQIQTINGIVYKQWYAGIGTGLDYYQFRGVPVFLDIRHNLLKKNSTPFIYSSIGIHYPWKRKEDTFNEDTQLYAGLFYDIGLGLNLAKTKNQGFYLSAGYSHKRVKQSFTNFENCLILPCMESKITRTNGLNRLSIKAGWRFLGN